MPPIGIVQRAKVIPARPFSQKVAPAKVSSGVEILEHDGEGRVQTAEFDKFFLVNVYVPNSKRDLSRLTYRQKWDRDFLGYLKN